MSELKEIKVCEVCGNDGLASVLNLGNHPLCDDLVPIGDPRVCIEYPIEILFCKNCCTAHQRFQVPKIELFPKSYHYRARFTADVLSGMAELVDACGKYFTSLEKKVVVDIGCNDGSLLDCFYAKKCITVGIEPTYAYADAKKNGHDVYNSFLSREVAESILEKYGHPDVITFTNVFAHIENLQEVISILKFLCSASTMIIIENHYMGSVLKTNQFDTFYHEHPRTYSYTSFVFIANSIGKRLNFVEFPSRYAGNIRVFIGGTADSFERIDSKKIQTKERLFLEKFDLMKLNIEKWKISKGAMIQALTKANIKIIGKAFPGRAAILIKMLGINEDVLSAVYEKPGSIKIGNYVPGTRIPILSDDQLILEKKKSFEILNLAWHISGEIKSYLAGLGFHVPVIDILSSDDWRVLT